MNSMKDILSAFDGAGKTTNSRQSNDSMKNLLESLDRIQESASMNISMSGDSPDDVAKLMNTITGGADSGSDEYDAEPVDYGNDGYADHEMDVFQGTLSGSGTMNRTQETYSNEPHEEYSDTDDVVNAPSDDLNKSKKSYNRAEPGDNPRAAPCNSCNERETKLREELSRSLRRHMKKLESK